MRNPHAAYREIFEVVPRAPHSRDEFLPQTDRLGDSVHEGDTRKSVIVWRHRAENADVREMLT